MPSSYGAEAVSENVSQLVFQEGILATAGNISINRNEDDSFSAAGIGFMYPNVVSGSTDYLPSKQPFFR